MSLIAMSRFSSLQIVEDDYVPPKPKEPKGKKIEPAKNSQKSDEKRAKNGPRKANKTNCNGSQANLKKKGYSSSKEIINNEQWEDAKCESDPINERFEDDIKRALLLSQLNFDKTCNDSINANKEIFKTQNGKRHRKNKSVIPNESHLEITGFQSNDHIDRLTIDDDPSYRKNSKKEISGSNMKREQPSIEEIKGSQLESVLEDKEKEIVTLKSTINKLKEELVKVKSRNKRLCGIIATSEMKEMAEVLIEVDELKQVQRELTTEVEILYTQLEQERSKTSSTGKTDNKFKLKSKNTKSVRFDVSTEKKRTLSDKDS